MGQQKAYPFDDTADYTKVNTVVEGGVGKLGLAPNPGEEFEQAFSSDTDFVYDDELVEFTGTQAEQKDTLADLQYHNNFNDNDTSPEIGTEPVTLNGGMNVAGAKLNNLTGPGNDGFIHLVPDFPVGLSQFTFRLQVYPSYSGSPVEKNPLIILADRTDLVVASQDDSQPSDSKLVISHETDGSLGLFYKENGTTLIPLTTFGSFNPIANNPYELEISGDTATGELHVYLGTSRVFTTSIVFNFTFNTSLLWMFANSGYYGATLGNVGSLKTDYDSLSIFNTMKNSGLTKVAGELEFSPGAAYIESVVELPTFVYGGVGEFQSIDNFSAVGQGTERYIIDGKYWNGSDWIVSNETFAEASPEPDVAANIGSLILEENGTIPVSVVFGTSGIQQFVDELTIEYTGQEFALSGSLTVVEPINANRVNEFLADFTEQDAGKKVRFVLQVDGVPKYHDGANWVSSNLTIAQSNTETEVSNNILNLINQEDAVDIFLVVLLETDDAQVSPEIDFASFEYNDFDECVVTAKLQDILLDVPAIDPTNPPRLHIKAHRSFTLEETVVLDGSQSAPFDIAGEASLSVVVTETVGEKLQFGISIPDGRGTKWVMFEPAIVPNLFTEEIQRISTVRSTDFG